MTVSLVTEMTTKWPVDGRRTQRRYAGQSDDLHIGWDEARPHEIPTQNNFRLTSCLFLEFSTQYFGTLLDHGYLKPQKAKPQIRGWGNYIYLFTYLCILYEDNIYVCVIFIYIFYIESSLLNIFTFCLLLLLFVSSLWSSLRESSQWQTLGRRERAFWRQRLSSTLSASAQQERSRESVAVSSIRNACHRAKHLASAYQMFAE